MNFTAAIGCSTYVYNLNILKGIKRTKKEKLKLKPELQSNWAKLSKNVI